MSPCGCYDTKEDDAAADCAVEVVHGSASQGSLARRPRVAKIEELLVNIGAKQYGSLHPHENLRAEFSLFDVKLFEDPGKGDNLRGYYDLCNDSGCLIVTMSCFSIWNKHGKTNGFAKVIPALLTPLGNAGAVHSKGLGCCPTSASLAGEVSKVFFFDDNLDMEGYEHSPGICNLRDIRNGDFVNFGVGHNGFTCHLEASHTLVHTSSVYSNVLVKANILDAMEDDQYFTNIISRYTQPGEKVVVYMDINSAIMCGDSVSGKGTSFVLLSTMFELLDLRPFKETDFVWDSRKPLRLTGVISLKNIAKKIAGDDKSYYNSLYGQELCFEFVKELMAVGNVSWRGQGHSLTYEAFKSAFDRYLVVLKGDVLDAGIARSWFACYQGMKNAGHSAVLNSFGIDTKTVVEKTVPNVSEVLQLTINFDLWDARDAKSFKSQYCSVSKSAP